MDVDLPGPLVEPTPRRIRVWAGQTRIADSRRALLLARYGPGRLPTYCIPPPLIECPRIAGLVCFFNERVDLVVDGVPETRPRTPWST